MRLSVDPTACRAVGICAHLAPGVVRLDRWGYPILPAGPDQELEGRDRRAAETAARACPHRALHLTP